MNSEPTIVINGVTLNPSHAATVRCALESFDTTCNIAELGAGPVGVELTKLYRRNITEIRRVLYLHLPTRGT